MTKDGVLVLIAQNHRTQERNRADARDRLIELIRQAAVVPVKRRPTRPTKASRERRIESKKRRARIKGQRQAKPSFE
jgi:ribosome-associated protein